jgi:16S rRNA (guanine966-N2)-methyltransferase
MRIIGGQAKGRRFAVPPGSAVRPTSDRIKEALFNILGPLEGLNFLDLYAGTGNVGIEALSRGAAGVVFVERIAALSLTLKRNLESFGFSGRYEMIVMDVEKAVIGLVEKTRRFDLIFADPPYRKGQIDKTMDLLNLYPSLLGEEGTLVLQHALAEPLQIKRGMAFELVDARRYGDTLLSFLKYLKP